MRFSILFTSTKFKTFNKRGDSIWSSRFFFTKDIGGNDYEVL